jgi:hypothetical protein
MILAVFLGDLIRDGKLLWLYCRDCFREREVDPSTIPLPPDVPVPEIGKRSVRRAVHGRSIAARSCIPAGLKRSETGVVVSGKACRFARGQ